MDINDKSADKKKNVLIISNDITLGGAALSLFDMLTALGNIVNFCVVVPGEGPVSERLFRMKVKTYVVQFLRDYIEINKYTCQYSQDVFYSNFSAAIKLIEIIKKENIDIVHTNSSVGNAGAIAAIFAGIPHVWHIRELMEEDFSARYCELELKKVLFEYSCLVAISKCVEESLSRKYGIISKQIYNAIGEADLSGTYCKSHDHTLLLAGAITENKGQWDAIKAVKLLRDRGFTDVVLTLAGRGVAGFIWIIEKYIKLNKLEKQIIIRDFVNDMRTLRSENSIALVTSKMEALGRVTVEAMCAGQLVIGADSGGTKELIGTDGERGFLYKQGDEKSLADTIEKVISLDSESKRTILNNAYSYAKSTFNATVYKDKLLSVYENCSVGTEPDEIRSELSKKQSLFLKESVYTAEMPKVNNNAKAIRELWSEIEAEGKSVVDYFILRKVKRIAIYGMGVLGRKLYDSLEKTDITIDYVADKEPGRLAEIIRIVEPDGKLERTDMLVVAVSSEEKELKAKYADKCDFEVVGLSEIISEIHDAEIG